MPGIPRFVEHALLVENLFEFKEKMWFHRNKNVYSIPESNDNLLW